MTEKPSGGKRAGIGRWLARGFVVVFALTVLVYFAGTLMPVGHTAVRTVTMEAPIGAVWALVGDPATHPDWRPSVARVERLPDSTRGRPVWREVRANGLEVVFEVFEYEPPVRLVVEIGDHKAPFGGSWTYELEAVGEGTTRLTVTERADVYSPFFRIVFRLFMDRHASVDAFVRSLERGLGLAKGKATGGGGAVTAS